MALSFHAGLFLGLAAFGLVTAGAASTCVSDADCGLQPGADGRATITLKARGPRLVAPPLPLTLPLRVQLWADGGACWEARYDTAGVTRNDVGGFTAKSE